MRSRLRLGRRACYLEWMSHVCACRRLAKSRREAVHVVLVAGTISRVSYRRCTIPLKNFEFYTSQTRHMSAILHVHTPHRVQLYTAHNKKDLLMKRIRARARSPPARLPPRRPPRVPSSLVVSPSLRRESARPAVSAGAGSRMGRGPTGRGVRGGCAAAPSAGGAGAVRRGAGGVRATCARPAAVRGRSARSRSPSGGVPWGPRGCAHRRLPPLKVSAPRVASPPVAPPPVAPLPVAQPLVDDREEVAPPSGGGYAHTRPRAADQWSAAAGVP